MTPLTVYDAIGIGFGPANLALSIAIKEALENDSSNRFKALFLEQKDAFEWHPQMVLENAAMQISFMKDLVTMRNPRSQFTFVNYLLTKNRLNSFINLREFYPSRIEFNDYYNWVAQQLDQYVSYSRKVIDIVPVLTDDSKANYLQIVAENCKTSMKEEFLAKNIVIATGGTPHFPDGTEPKNSKNIFHSSVFLSMMANHFKDVQRAYKFIVVGSGQSGAEIFHYLITHYPNADVTSMLRGFCYKPADDSEFVNEMFDPSMVTTIYNMKSEQRDKLLSKHSDVNFSVVDVDLIRALYKMLYEQKVCGSDRFRIVPFQHLIKTVNQQYNASAQFISYLNDETTNIEADAIILATGYDWIQNHPLLSNLKEYFYLDESNKYHLSRYYQIQTKPTFKPKIFLQSLSENSHGPSDRLLSVLPHRSSEIFQELNKSNVTRLPHSSCLCKMNYL